MGRQEKQVGYRTTNTYETLNEVTGKTKNVWIVLHGIGYLSKYFLRYFEDLNPEENYVIAPQAPSKYYLKNEYKHVGASWLTKERTELEVQNVVAYLNAVYQAENIPEHCQLYILGFSQGVSIATRWVARGQIKCRSLILYAGGIPNELTPDDFSFLETNNTSVSILVGNRDEYLNAERLQQESIKMEKLFKGRAKQIIFEGGHELKKELIHQLI
ncbi:MAG: esterase [Maribacter sp.]